MGRCLKCIAYKFIQFGRKASTQSKANVQHIEVVEDNVSKYDKKIKLIYGKSKTDEGTNF